MAGGAVGGAQRVAPRAELYTGDAVGLFPLGGAGGAAVCCWGLLPRGRAARRRGTSRARSGGVAAVGATGSELVRGVLGLMFDIS